MKNFNYLANLILLCVFFFSASLMAYDLSMSVGNLCEYVGKIQTNESGKTNLCSLNPYLSGSIISNYNNQFSFSSEFGFSVPQSGRDKNINKMSIIALANTKYSFDNLHFIGGAGFFFTRIAGKGGTQELKNGNSSIAYPMPDTTVYTRNFILNLGLGLDFNKEWAADLHTYIFNVLTKEDRAFSIAINGTYNFGEFK
jgi:hypothetical protein